MLRRTLKFSNSFKRLNSNSILINNLTTSIKLISTKSIYNSNNSIKQQQKTLIKRSLATMISLTNNNNKNYKVNAPSPFITSKGNPFDNLLPGYELIKSTNTMPEYALFTKEIIKSPNDDRLYK